MQAKSIQFVFLLMCSAFCNTSAFAKQYLNHSNYICSVSIESNIPSVQSVIRLVYIIQHLYEWRNPGGKIVSDTGMSLIYEEHEESSCDEPELDILEFGYNCHYVNKVLKVTGEHAVILSMIGTGGSECSLSFRNYQDAVQFMNNVKRHGYYIVQGSSDLCVPVYEYPGIHIVDEYKDLPDSSIILDNNIEKDENGWYSIAICLE